ncbi:18096_t:CDS:1, partial [Gigaspora rosea]
FSNIPSLKGKIYSYFSLPTFTSLGVHINGTFDLSSDRKNIVFQADGDLLTAETRARPRGMPRHTPLLKKLFKFKPKKNRRKKSISKKSEKSSMSPSLTKTTTEGKWNRYILLDVLPPLHSRLLEHIANKLKSSFNDQILSKLWPITSSTSNIYREYGLNVLQELYTKKHKVFWTVANGGTLIPLDEAYLVDSDDSTIADILIARGINLEIVKLSKDKLDHIDKMIETMQFKSTKSITPELVCSLLQNHPNILKVESEKMHKMAF